MKFCNVIFKVLPTCFEHFTKKTHRHLFLKIWKTFCYLGWVVLIKCLFKHYLLTNMFSKNEKLVLLRRTFLISTIYQTLENRLNCTFMCRYFVTSILYFTFLHTSLITTTRPRNTRRYDSPAQTLKYGITELEHSYWIHKYHLTYRYLAIILLHTYVGRN